MKSKIKRHSRSALSIILAMSMLISCMMVGIIATDAAKVTDGGTEVGARDDDSVGANYTYFPKKQPLYADYSDISSWIFDDSARIYVKFYKDGTTTFSWATTEVIGNNKLVFNVPDGDYDKMVFARVKAGFDSSQSWDSINIYNSCEASASSVDSTKNCFKISNDNGIYFDGWSTFTQNFYVIGTPSNNEWDVNNNNKIAFVESSEPGKYYAELNNMPSSKWYFAVSNGYKRYAHKSSSHNLDILSNGGSDGDYSHGDNSWTYEGGEQNVKIWLDTTGDYRGAYPFVSLEVTSSSSYKLVAGSTEYSMTETTSGGVFYTQQSINRNTTLYVKNGSTDYKASSSSFQLSALNSKIKLSASNSTNAQLNMGNGTYYVCFRPSNGEFWVQSASPDAATKTIYFDNAANWSTVYMYLYSKSGNNVTLYNGTWPGAQIITQNVSAYTVTEGKNSVWKIEGVDAAAQYVIFSNGTNQTAGKEVASSALADGSKYKTDSTTTANYTSWEEKESSSSGNWTLIHWDGNNTQSETAMTETPAGSGIYKTSSKVALVNGTAEVEKFKFKDGNTLYGPAVDNSLNDGDLNVKNGSGYVYDVIADQTGDYVYRGTNGEYYVWLDTNGEVNRMWIEGDDDDDDTPTPQGNMMDLTGWTKDTSYKVAYVNSNDGTALKNGTDAGVDVYTKNGEYYADLTPIINTIQGKTDNNFQLAFVKNEYFYSDKDDKCGGNDRRWFIIGMSTSARSVEAKLADNVPAGLLSVSAQSNNFTKTNFTDVCYHYYGIINSIDSDVTNVGIKLSHSRKDNDDWGQITYTFYAKTTPSADVPSVSIYAKDGMIRSGYQTFANHADTTIDSITLPNGTAFTGNIVDNTGAYYATTSTKVPKGSTITFTTTLDSTLRATHYVKGFCINGVTYEVYNKNTTGSQSMTWKIPSNFADKYVEITPIYYLIDDSNTKELKVEGFDKTVQETGWGNTLAIYPYYNGKSNTENAFGGYPGQPLIFDGGKYYIQIPITHDGTSDGAEIRGLTLSNNYWDSRHVVLDKNLSDHRQTYDYDDFFKLYREKNPDTIIISYKYRVAKDNYGDGYPYEGGRDKGSSAGTITRDMFTKRAGGNGIETYKDYFDRDIDLFSNLITDNNKKIENNPASKLLVVSNGYTSTFAGDYATEWNIYKTENSGTSYKYVTSIAPSILYMNNADSWAAYQNGSTSGAGQMASYKDRYTNLKTNYSGWPVEITWEREIRNYSKDQANRLDARWFYSKNTDQIQASVRIEYMNNGRYIEDPFSTTVGYNGKNNVGYTTGTKAYFTNTTPNIKGETASGKVVVNSQKSFTFQAEEATGWEFVGWYLLRGDTYTDITDSLNGSSPMNSNDIYVARFRPNTSGTLAITHIIDPASTGSGTPYLTVQIKDDSNNVVETFERQTGSIFRQSQYINHNYDSYTVNVTIDTVADNSSLIDSTTPFRKDIPSGVSAYDLAAPTIAADQKTGSTTATFTVAQILAAAEDSSIGDAAFTIRYVSLLNKEDVRYEYNVTYSYVSRFWGTQKYVISGAVDDVQVVDYISGSKTSATLTSDFLREKTPYQTTFRQIIDWDYNSVEGNSGADETTDGTTKVYTITAAVHAKHDVNDKVTAEFRMPYKHDSTTGTIWAETPFVENTDHNLFDESVASKKITTRIGCLFNTDEDKLSYDDTGWTDELAGQYHFVTAPEYLYKVKESFENAFVFTYSGHDTDYYLKALNGESGYVLTAEEAAKYPDYSGFSVAKKIAVAQELYDISYNSQYVNDYKTYFGDVYTFAETDDTYTRKYTYYEESTTADPETGETIEARLDEVTLKSAKITDIKTNSSNLEKKYFSYWNVTNTKGDAVTKVYTRDFNYSGYDNYFVTPKFESSQAEYTALRGNQNLSSTITYLGETRNQWNIYNAAYTAGFDKNGNSITLEGKQIKNAENAGSFADKILEDFALSYVYRGEKLKETLAGRNDVKLGVVIQQIGELSRFSDGSYITNPAYYQENCSDTIEASVASIKTLIDSDSTVSKPNGQGIYVKASLTLENLDNKNRLQYYYTFNNKAVVKNQSTNHNENTAASAAKDAKYQDKKYAYRAFTYIQVGEEQYVSLAPAYFTFYDLAMM